MNINKVIQSAFENHQKGKLEQAECLYKKILQKQPDNPDILHMLGVLFCQSANYDSAIKYIRKALQIGPADSASAYYNLGTALQEKGKLDEAITHYQKAIGINPNFTEAYCNLGTALQEKGKLDEAITHYQKAIGINPNFVKAHYNLANALRKRGQLDAAIHCYQKAIGLNPNFIKAYYNLANVLREKGQFDEAVLHCQRAIRRDPSCAEAYYNLGSALREKGQFDEAIPCYQKAIGLNPNFSKAYCNLGATLWKKGQLDAAIPCYQKAIELNPNFAEAYCNMGTVLQEKGQFDEAISHYQKAIELNPTLATANLDMALLLLLLGNFKEGWQQYEWRWKTKDFIQNCRNFSYPLWNGSEISGLTILLECEQGLGDTIQFIRYAPLIAQKGAKVIVDSQRELASLIASVEGVQQVIVQGEELNTFDLYCPLLSLPLLFNTTFESIPLNVPYIMADSSLVKKWKDKVQYDNSSMKIGLVWAGKPTHKNERNRSCPLEVFSPLSELRDISLYSLQKGEAAKQAKATPGGIKLIDYTEEIIDFADTAAFMENLDLIISVDTSVVHLAGALAKPVWTLLPFSPDWRWMLNREDSPWYPSMRLFRQSSIGDWKSVIAKVKDELLRLLDSH